MATAYLKWTTIHGEEHILALTDEVVLGRSSHSDVVFSQPEVSRSHAKLIKNSNGYDIQNLSSSHRTFVNGRPVDGLQHLHSGDRIRLAPSVSELHYFVEVEESAGKTDASPAGDDLEKCVSSLSSLLSTGIGTSSQLFKISSILEFQYEWEKVFSPAKAFEQILRAALKNSEAERGFVMLKQGSNFDYVAGMNSDGQPLSSEEFLASQSIARQVANEEKPVFMPETIIGSFAQQQSIVGLRLRSIACMPLRWMAYDSSDPQVRGVLYLDSTQSMRAMSGFDEKILNKLAQEAGNVFEKLEMLKTFEERKKLKLELDLIQNELVAADALRRAEAQVLRSEYSASMGRFAAALSHELNSPLGALKNALQTSMLLTERKRTAAPEKRAELESIESELHRTSLESIERLRQIVLRIQRVTNLDRDEALPVDLNSLLQDVVDMLESRTLESVKLRRDFQPLPEMTVRPQQMSAVFLNLIQNAIDGSKESGTDVVVATRHLQSAVEIVVEDRGRGMSSEELSGIFDPAFKVKERRVATANWGLFSSRQIVREHGGDIDIQSTLGQGTVVRIALPVSA
jgi:signal transduction histidine kinase